MEYEKENRKSTSLAFVLAVYATSRAFYLIWGSLLVSVVPISSFQRVTLDVPFGSMNAWWPWAGTSTPQTMSPRLSSHCTRYS
jgi:hypothetical protein